MRYLLLGFLLGISVATAYSSWAECCGAFNVPFDTQLEIERQQIWREAQRPIPLPQYQLPSLPSDPCDRGR